MASVTKQDIPEVSNLMADYWNLIKQIWIPEEKDSPYWQDMIKKCEELSLKYRGSHIAEYVDRLILALQDEISRRSKLIQGR